MIKNSKKYCGAESPQCHISLYHFTNYPLALHPKMLNTSLSNIYILH